MPVSTCKMSEEGISTITDKPVAEKILEKRISRHGFQLYLVQWKEDDKLEERTFIRSDCGMVTTTNTWEKPEDISDYKHLVEDWENTGSEDRRNRISGTQVQHICQQSPTSSSECS